MKNLGILLLGGSLLVGCAVKHPRKTDEVANFSGEDETSGSLDFRLFEPSDLAPVDARWSEGQAAKVGSSVVYELDLGVPERSRFDNGDANRWTRVVDTPVSTFAADVDRASYAFAKKALAGWMGLPPPESVRTEEFVNAFTYAYPQPEGTEAPFRAAISVFPTPWDARTELIRIGIQGRELDPVETPASNVVLLLDVSGSMAGSDRLPLLKQALGMLTDQLDADDTVAIVVYAGAAGVVLEPTAGDQRATIRSALDRLKAGGSTAGGAGLALAYDLAAQQFDPEKTNRVILCTDGDFNVGVTGDQPLTDFVASKRRDGIYLSVLGFGMGNLNDQMMQSIAQNGNGIAAYIGDVAEARRVLVQEFNASMVPLADDVKFQVEFNPAAISAYRLLGYQTRLLAEEDFTDDAVDAGEIGSGHRVTALYEVTRAGSEGVLPERRYAEDPPPTVSPSDELAYLKMRYKPPGADESRLIERAITPADVTDAPDDDAVFAAAAAAFAEALADRTQPRMRFAEIAELARAHLGDDPGGERQELVDLIGTAATIADEPLQASSGDGDPGLSAMP